MSDAAELRAYLAGWDEGQTNLLETLAWIPDEQLVGVVRRLTERRLTEQKENRCRTK